MWNFQKLPSYTFYEGNVVCCPVHYFSLPPIFTLVAASISHFLTAAIKLSRYSSNEIGLICFFISGFSSFSVLERKNQLRCCFVSLKVRVLEMQNITPVYMKGRTYVRTIFSEPKFLGCIVYQIFLPMVLHLARESSAMKGTTSLPRTVLLIPMMSNFSQALDT